MHPYAVSDYNPSILWDCGYIQECLSHIKERTMTSTWRSRLVAFLVIPVVAILSAPLQSMAQQIDVAAAQKRFQDLYAAGDYSAALAEAQKTEAAAKRSGTNNFTYVSALNDLLAPIRRWAIIPKQEGCSSRWSTPCNGICRRPIRAWLNHSPIWQRCICCKPNPGAAEKLYKQALDITTKGQTEPNQAVALLMNNLGDVYKGQARYDEAEAQYQRALEMAEKTSRPDSLRSPWSSTTSPRSTRIRAVSTRSRMRAGGRSHPREGARPEPSRCGRERK